MENQHITTGEVFRRLEDIDERFTKTLDNIQSKVTATNGTVIRHGERLTHLERAVQTTVTTTTTTTPENDAFKLNFGMSKRMGALIGSLVAGLSLFGPDIKELIVNVLVGK